MSFSFFKALRPKTPQELAKAIKDSLMALDTKTVVEVKALEKVCNNSQKISISRYFEAESVVNFWSFVGNMAFS